MLPWYSKCLHEHAKRIYGHGKRLPWHTKMLTRHYSRHDILTGHVTMLSRRVNRLPRYCQCSLDMLTSLPVHSKGTTEHGNTLSRHVNIPQDKLACCQDMLTVPQRLCQCSLYMVKVSMDIVHIYLVILETNNIHNMILSRHCSRLSSLGIASIWDI
jgi:hypothetical protein